MIYDPGLEFFHARRLAAEQREKDKRENAEDDALWGVILGDRPIPTPKPVTVIMNGSKIVRIVPKE